jgi:hypothetical protein
MTSSLDPLENQLLAALPDTELQLWLPDLGLSCECYAVVKKEYDRLLPAQTAH